MPIRPLAPGSVESRLRWAALACAVVAAGAPLIAAAAAAPKPPRPPVYVPPDPTAATKPESGKPATSKLEEALPAGPVVAEGAAIADRVGRLERDDKSPFARITFPPASASAKPTSIAVAPNQMLRAMEESAGEASADFRVTGTVTMYRGRNLLVIDSASPSAAATSARAVSGGPATVAAAAPASTTRPATTATAPAAERTATAEQLLGEMLKAPPKAGGGGGGESAGQALRKPEAPPETDSTSGKGAVKPGAPAVSVLREGTYLIDRLGRLTRGADGTTPEFTFESDGAALQDPPVVIIPNLKLMAMEDAVNAINRDLRFRITGMVTEYRGRNYVLLEKAVVVPDATQQFRRTQE